MAEQVIMPKADWTNALNAVRTKSKTSDLLLSSQVADAILAIPSGGSGGNCEAHVVDAINPKVNFTIITSGAVKAWGTGLRRSGLTSNRVGFYGDKYIAGLGQPETLNLTINSEGNVIGLPPLTEGTLLITRGI